jgi:hypothetical protein
MIPMLPLMLFMGRKRWVRLSEGAALETLYYVVQV